MFTWNLSSSGIILTNNKNIFFIYQVYTRYIPYIKSIYQVYTRYKNGINLSYDKVIHIPGIYLLKHFKGILVPVTYPFGHGIYQVKTWYIPCPNGYVTGTEIPLKCLRGIYQVYESLRHMSGLYHYYTRYIPGIYFLCKVYTWYILYI